MRRRQYGDDHRTPLLVNNRDSTISHLSGAMSIGDWEVASAIALAGIYGELVRLNDRLAKR